MATELFGANPGYSLEQVVAGTGQATVAHNVELLVDCSAAIVTDNGTTRKITREEVLLVLNLFAQYITRMNWPPV